MKKLLMLTMLIFSFNAFAVDCDHEMRTMTDGAAKSAAIIACMKADKEVQGSKSSIAKAADGVDMDLVTKIATQYSSAIVTMASEMGVAVNDFIKTDAGKLATGAIIWTIFGDDIKGVVFAPLIALFILIAGFKTSSMIAGGSYEARNGKDVFVKTNWHSMSEAQSGWFLITRLVTCVVAVIVLCQGLL